MLPNQELAPAYDQVVWLYNFQDFTRTRAGRKADRVAIRFGMTSWPQLLLIDPSTLEVIGKTGRSVKSFLKAVAGARIQECPSPEAARSRLENAERLAVEIEERPSRANAEAGLEHRDIVVRMRALDYLAGKAPDRVLRRAETLLLIPSDPIRFRVLSIVAEHGNSKFARLLDRLLASPSGSANPNVLRIRSAQALARCGDPGSIDGLATHATTGDFYNGLTRTALAALVSIAGRHPDASDRVRNHLINAYPPPQQERPTRVKLTPRQAATANRLRLNLAKRVHQALGQVTGKSVDFPVVYDARALEKLRAAWK